MDEEGVRAFVDGFDGVFDLRLVGWDFQSGPRVLAAATRAEQLGSHRVYDSGYCISCGRFQARVAGMYVDNRLPHVAFVLIIGRGAVSSISV